MKSVIDRLRELREDHDLSQRDIAAVLGISQQHYSKYEVGEYELPLRHFITLANYYRVSADFLIGRCADDTVKPTEMVYVIRNYSCEKLIRDTLSLGEHGRASVVEYIGLQKLREKQSS